jgi:NitT/TauT family transport system substrate-binding protein
MTTIHTRRRFLTTLSLAGAAGLVRAPPLQAAEGPPEITSVRITKPKLGLQSVCLAPTEIAAELLQAEGFTDVRYVDTPGNIEETIARGEADFGQSANIQLVSAIDRDLGITALTGLHVGCYEVFGKEEFRGFSDLKGKSVGAPTSGLAGQGLLSLMAAQVGLDPGKDINWVYSGSVDPMQLFVDGKIAAFLSYPPQAQELRARHVGRVLLKTAVDRPWSQYFCCMLAGNREFVGNYPAATKRVTRAFVKAADLCASEPARVAQRLVDRRFTPRYDYALEALSELPYDKWREYEPEDTLRFYALRMRESGFIKSTHRRSSATAPIGAFSTSSNASLRRKRARAIVLCCVGSERYNSVAPRVGPPQLSLPSGSSTNSVW